jgi:hypothetical protein
MDDPKTAQVSFCLTINKGTFQPFESPVPDGIGPLNRFDQKLLPVFSAIRCLDPFRGSRVRLVQKAYWHR